MVEQSQTAIEAADIILFLYDSKVGVTEEDKYLANWLNIKIEKYNNSMKTDNQEEQNNDPSLIKKKYKTIYHFRCQFEKKLTHVSANVL